MRGEVLEMARLKTSEVGRSAAIILKEKNIPLEQLFIKYAKDIFSKAPDRLSTEELDDVALEIVAASGRTGTKVNNTMRNLGRAGRPLWVLTAIVASYNVFTSENPTVTAGRELSNVAGGMGGTMLASAAVGAMVSGPLAPLGAAVGAVVGGLLGAVLADEVYVESVVPKSGTTMRILPRFCHLFSRDEEGMANALYEECGINIDQVCEVIEHLNEYYTSDADDVVVLYVEIVRKYSGSTEQALKLHPSARNLLIETMESGWTDSRERQAIEYLSNL
ncbi:MAG: hypothetical protein WBD27_10815 [Pyrinomonadaceae bacterium]